MEITRIDIDEIRAAFSKIAARVKNAPDDFIASIRGSTAAKTEAYIDQLETLAACCSCEAKAPAVVLRTKNRPVDFLGQLSRLKRMVAEDKVNGWDKVAQTIAEHKSVGLREVPPPVNEQIAAGGRQ